MKSQANMMETRSLEGRGRSFLTGGGGKEKQKNGEVDAQLKLLPDSVLIQKWASKTGTRSLNDNSDHRDIRKKHPIR